MAKLLLILFSITVLSACVKPSAEQSSGGTTAGSTGSTASSSGGGSVSTSGTGGSGPCPEGLTLCDGSCVDTSSDNSNCGACGNACGMAVGFMFFCAFSDCRGCPGPVVPQQPFFCYHDSGVTSPSEYLGLAVTINGLTEDPPSKLSGCVADLLVNQPYGDRVLCAIDDAPPSGGIVQFQPGLHMSGFTPTDVFLCDAQGCPGSGVYFPRGEVDGITGGIQNGKPFGNVTLTDLNGRKAITVPLP